MLIEVKNHKRKTEAQDIEAFVTKARDKQADKVVFVNTAGYQEGAIDVARRHSVELFSVTFDERNLELSTTASHLLLSKASGDASSPPILYLGDRQPVTVVVGVVLVYTDGQRHEVPSEASQMTYYLQRTKCADGHALVELVSNGLPDPDIGQTAMHSIVLASAQRITPPDEFFYPAGELAEIECEVKGDYGRPIEGNVRIDPGAFAPLVIYKNVVTGEELSFPMHMLPLGEGSVEPSHFYFLENPLRYFYCAAVKGSLVSWRLVEGFQAGELVRGDFLQEIQYARYYIPVTNSKILERLRHRLVNMGKLGGKR